MLFIKMTYSCCAHLIVRPSGQVAQFYPVKV
uniref:Uncharacterized protein n=1 Tax=Rhizophora mucronata TaxID=61149 RepID=A0A2P2MYV1_RHIMU